MVVEPVHGEPAAVATVGDERILVVADYHAGIEAGLRREGVELASRAEERRDALTALVDRERPDRLVLLGDLAHAIGDPGRDEREEIRALFDALPDSLPVTLVKGNHDGDAEDLLGDLAGDITITPGRGTRLGPVGFAHGHTWPGPDVLEAEIVCMGHEHPTVRMEDEVGGRRIERVWLRGDLAVDPFEAFHGTDLAIDGELVVFPAFNGLSGGTWVNIDGQEFLSPFLPEALEGGEAYLLDGMRLGPYRRV